MNSAVVFEHRDNFGMVDRANVRTPVKDLPSLSYDCSSSPFYSSPRSLFGGSSNADPGQYNMPSGKAYTQNPMNGPYVRSLEPHHSSNGLNTLASSPPGYAYGMDEKAISPMKLRQQPFRNPDLDTRTRKPSETMQKIRLNNYRKANDNFVQHYRHLENASTLNAGTTNSKRSRSSHQSKSKLRRISENGDLDNEDCTSFLLSAHVFSKACEAQRSLLSEIPPPPRTHQTDDVVITRNLCFESKVDENGRVSIIPSSGERSPLTSYSHCDESKKPPKRANFRKTNAGKFFNIKKLIGDQDLVWDSENEEEGELPESRIPKTPPRFGNLGSCDAATAFAKTLTRSRDEGFGSLFMFPLYNTPDSTRITPFVPCTPRIPSELNDLEESAFASNVMTPPGAIYTYEQNAMFTGLTPFLVNDQEA